MPELIALAKANPGKYSFASSGAGTSPQISGELFKQLAGVNLLHVPYRGSAPAHQDLLAGQVDMMFDNIPGPLGLMRGGKVQGFAVTSKERHPAVPDIPTMAEFLPGYEITSWGGICGPAGLPPAMVEKLSALAKKALESPAVKEAFDKQGATRDLDDPRRHRGLPRRQREAAGAGHQGVGREGGVRRPSVVRDVAGGRAPRIGGRLGPGGVAGKSLKVKGVYLSAHPPASRRWRRWRTIEPFTSSSLT